MVRQMAILGLVVAVMAAGGCTSVQKGTAAGSAVGSGVGAAAGHTISGVGSGPGALAGLALGGVGGALAADHYYEPEDTGELATARQTIEELRANLKAREGEMAEARSALQREKAQQKALLQAYEKARKQRSHASLQANVPSNVQVTQEDDAVKFTILSKVLFDSGKADLSKSGKAAVAAAARTIRQRYPDARIQVRGHTDNVPIRYSGYKSNWELSCARALAVARHMTGSLGFDPGRISTMGCGETQPVASNKTAAGRSKNRRAEIIVRPSTRHIASAQSEG